MSQLIIGFSQEALNHVTQNCQGKIGNQKKGSYRLYSIGELTDLYKSSYKYRRKAVKQRCSMRYVHIWVRFTIFARCNLMVFPNSSY